MESKGKIVHLIGDLERGGDQTQLFQLGLGLQERGWRQAVVSFDRQGVWKELLEKKGFPVVEIPRHPFKPWRLWRLQRFIRRERPDIVLSWAPHVAVYAHWLCHVGPLRRIVNVRGDLTVDSIFRRDRHRRAPVSPRHRESRPGAEQFPMGSSSSATDRHEAAPEHCDLQHRAGLWRGHGERTGGSTAIAAVGALKPLKAYDVLLHALGLLAAQGRKFQLLLAGDGPERASLENLAERLGLAKRVQFWRRRRRSSLANRGSSLRASVEK